MAMFDHGIRTRQGSCPAHGQVTAEKRVPKIKFPFFVTGAARGAAGVATVPLPVVRGEGVMKGWFDPGQIDHGYEGVAKLFALVEGPGVV